VSASENRFRELLLRALSGDATAYHLFLKELCPYLRAYFRRRLAGLPDEVEDLVQEVLLAMHNQRHTYEKNQPLTAWIHAIARHKMVDLLRRRGKQDVLTTPLDDDTDMFAHSEIDAGDARHDVMKLLERLPDRQRLPIQHMKLEGLSAEETARLTGMSVSAVKVGIHRGLKMLAVLIKDER